MVAATLAFRPFPANAQAIASGSAVPPPIPKTRPKTFAVLPFEARDGAAVFMRVSLPFLFAELAEIHPGLRPVYGPMVVSMEPLIGEDADKIAAFAKKQGVEWVFTGWFRKTDVELEMAISLWQVSGTAAKRLAEVQSKGPLASQNTHLADALTALCQKGGLPMPADRRPQLAREPSRDLYALTLFGRGLGNYTGIAAPPDFAKARKDLERAVFIDPTLAPAHRILGELNLQEGQTRRAKNELEYAIEIRGDYPQAALSLAKSEREAGKLETARDLWLLILRARPWDLEARFQLATLLWEQGDVEGALREQSQVVNFLPDDQRVRRALVVIYASRGDRKQLVTQLEKVVELAPADQETRLDLAAAYASLGQEDKAIQAYQAIISADAQNVQALKLLGDLYRGQGDLTTAIKYYGQAMDAKPTDPRPYFLLGAAYLEIGNDVEAKKVYLKAQRFKEFLPEAQNNLGAILYREGNVKESVGYLKRAVESRPKKVRYRYNYALSLSKTESNDEALRQIDAGLKLDDKYSELHYLKGVVLLRKGDAKGARNSFTRTLELVSDHVGASHNLKRLDELERRERDGEVTVEEPE